MYKKSEVVEESLKYFNGDNLAADVVTKYLLRVPEGDFIEKSPDEMHRRLAKNFARAESKYPNPLSEDEIYELFKGFRYLVAQGSPMSAIGNSHQIQSLSNCFVIDQPEDSYGGILLADQEQVQIMKRRGGVGFDISKIRPRGVTTSNAARTTDGIGVFMERFSNSCREVAQGGRRGALMLTIDCRHPEIETFINVKRDLTKVTGANISIKFTDDFLQAVESSSDYTLRWPVTASVGEASITKTVSAKQIWDQFVDSAWTSAEPGALFWDTVKKTTPADIYESEGYGSISTNPCIIGSTLLATADGRNAVSIKQLAEEGRDVPVYSTNPKTGQVEIKYGRNPRLTKKQAEVWKLTLDDGSSLIATPDHRIMKRDCSYVELQNLQPGDSVFPFSSFNSNGYRQVCNTGVEMTGGARRNKRQYLLIHEFHHGPTDSKNFAIHHNDFNSLNDSIDNLQVMLHTQHQDLHSKNMVGELNPYHQMSAEWKKNFATHPGETNGRYSGHTNDQLLEHGRNLFNKHGKITGKIWADHAKENGLPQFLTNEFRFGTWQNFVNQVSNNHKVISVEKFGEEDVYNITVDDNHNYHVITSHEDDKFVVSSGLCVKNCGEIVLCPYDSCRLMALNLSSFVIDPFKPQAEFDFALFSEVVLKSQRLMDDLVDLEIEAVDRIRSKIANDPQPENVKRTEVELWDKIRDKALKARRTGLGVTALGDTLAMLGLRYGSDESIAMTEKIYRQMAVSAHKSSIQMAEERGAFPVFNYEKEKDHDFLQEIIGQIDPEFEEKWRVFGRRNIALTTTAPTGSVSCLTQTTSGIEPAYLLSYKRRRKLVSNTDAGVVPDFVDASGDKWQEYTVYHHNFKKWMNVTGKTAVEDSPYHNATSNDIDWMKSVEIQAAAQKWIDHSISKTCNLPNSATKELVSQVYMTAWKSGCKGFTVYRDGCRAGVLVQEDKKEEKSKEDSTRSAEKRPREMPCDIHRVSIKGDNWLVLVGLKDGGPYETFCGIAENIEVPKKSKTGVIVKNGKKDGVATYNLSVPVGNDDEVVFKDIVNLFANPTHSAFTRTLSLTLRHQIPINFIIEQLQKGKNEDMFSFSRVLARVLKTYIPDGTKSTGDKTCKSCGSDSLVYMEGCITCSSCGSSKCS